MPSQQVLLDAECPCCGARLQLLFGSGEGEIRKRPSVDPRVVGEVSLTAQSLDKLPWKPYPNGKGAWIFSNLPEPTAKTLCDLLNKNNGKLELHGQTYRFSGLDKKFIARQPK